jgi:cytidylate kinase
MDKISLAGDLGSGKSTVAAILINRLNAEYYSTGAIVRSIAAKKGMSVVELNEYMETHPEIDREIDDGLKELSSLDKMLIIDSRMAWHFTEGTFKVYLSADPETSAFRIMNANRQGEHNATLEDTVRDTLARRKSEQKRYMEQYGVDIKDLSNYSLIVDTSAATPEKIAELIIDEFEKWQENKERRAVYISPLRVNYPDDAPDSEKLENCLDALEDGSEITGIEICERDTEFYIVSGVEGALAYSLSLYDFIPATLVKAKINPDDFVKMKNSL